MMAAKPSPENCEEINRLWKIGGWSLNKLGARFGVTPTTVKMIVNPEYAQMRRSAINAARNRRPPPSEIKRRAAAKFRMPSLAQV